MSQSAKARRSGLLCCHFLRNLAFYRAWFKAGQPHNGEQFWINSNANFLDVAVLEWCKLFADTKGKHHFSRALADPATFKADLLEKLELTAQEFGAYVDTFKIYRDKFIAHLDDENIMHIPDMKIARRSAKFLYQSLLEQEANNTTFRDAPASAKAVYKDFLTQGLKVFEK